MAGVQLNQCQAAPVSLSVERVHVCEGSACSWLFVNVGADPSVAAAHSVSHAPHRECNTLKCYSETKESSGARWLSTHGIEEESWLSSSNIGRNIPRQHGILPFSRTLSDPCWQRECTVWALAGAQRRGAQSPPSIQNPVEDVVVTVTCAGSTLWAWTRTRIS